MKINKPLNQKTLKTPAQVRFMLSKRSKLTDRQKNTLRALKSPTSISLPKKDLI